MDYKQKIIEIIQGIDNREHLRKIYFLIRGFLS